MGEETLGWLAQLLKGCVSPVCRCLIWAGCSVRPKEKEIHLYYLVVVMESIFFPLNFFIFLKKSVTWI